MAFIIYSYLNNVIILYVFYYIYMFCIDVCGVCISISILEHKIIKLTKCKWCGTEFIKQHNRQVYCSEYCKKEGRLEQKRINERKYYKQYIKEEGIQTYQKYKKDLGTGSLSMHPNPNINIELQLVQKEMKRLKIKA